MKTLIFLISLSAFGQTATPTSTEPTIAALKAEIRLLKAQLAFNALQCQIAMDANVAAATKELQEAQKAVDALKPKEEPKK